jgi:hypothetical protein
MRFPATVLCVSAASLLIVIGSYGAEELPIPAKMPVPKNAAPAAAPTSVPQSQNERMFLKYKGEPLSADEIGKSTRPAPIGGPSKF